MNVYNKPNEYLKWENEVVGLIYDDGTVKLSATPKSEQYLKILFGGKTTLTKQEYITFLEDRLISKSRKDINKILRRVKLAKYDIFEIADKTKAINPKDLLWITNNKNEKLVDALNGQFTEIFKHNINIEGSSLNSPGGINEKRYGISRDQYGIIKKRIYNVITDAESEVAVYKLGKLLGVDVCPAWFVDKDNIFSQFTYDFTKEYFIHARRFYDDGEDRSNLYTSMVNKFPEEITKIQQMCLLDFITRQDDRHLSNIGFILKGNDVRFYPLYDNGRSLFYEDTDEIIADAITNIELYATAFGDIGTYYDVACDIAKDTDISKLINLQVHSNEIYEMLLDSGFKGNKLEGAYTWIIKSLDILKNMF